MQSEVLGQLFFKELEKIIVNNSLDAASKVQASYRVLNQVFVEFTRQEKLLFSTLFARISYVSHQQQLGKVLQYYIHTFRRRASGGYSGHEETILQLGYKVLQETIHTLWQIPVPATLETLVPSDWPIPFTPSQAQSRRPWVRVLLLADHPEQTCFIGKDEARPEESIRIRYNIPERNDNFEPTIKVIRAVFQFPVTINLLDVEIDDQGVYRPQAFVVEPDYLIDVSAVAECFRDGQPDPWSFLLKRYLPFVPAIPLVVGNIANFFLDELMTRKEVVFQDLKKKIFQTNPLVFCLFEDAQVREIIQNSQLHYITLKQMVGGGFADQQIEPDDCFLEPTFFSERYGLQGRLDVFYRDPNGGPRSAIVELKSGKPFMPNTYGIGASHYIQTLLYDLLIRSAFGAQLDPTCFILYSGQQERPLRFAPVVKAQQYEALQIRNQLVAIEYLLAKLGMDEGSLEDQGQKLFGRLNPSQAKGFAQRDLALFNDVFQALTPLEKSYFTAFSGFIAREHQLAKTGVQHAESFNGMASLWLNKLEEKKENFEILSHLKVVENQAKNANPIVVFSRTEQTDPLANFRKGDIAVLYPLSDDVLSNQIFKCTIIELNHESVSIRLRSPQFNDSLFSEALFWNLEHDLLDSSFNSQYRGLFEWASTVPEKRRLLMGLLPPGKPLTTTFQFGNALTEEQTHILNRALAAPDYFLLWGPPGTGKTSIMLANMVKWLLENTTENILLLAYTNRAVDEICMSIESLLPTVSTQYFRIGSRYSTDERFYNQLLENLIADAGSRQALKAIIDSRRIVVATVASIASRPELLQLKSFQRVIVDEASQILEPMLVGILPRFKQFILIGDHKQLPAVVTQSSEVSAVRNEQLYESGFTNLRNALFERLYKQCQVNGWDWAYAQLSHQGRMHTDIMAFPNEFFYEQKLHILPAPSPYSQQQTAPLNRYSADQSLDVLEQLLCKSRAIFLPTTVDESSASQKTNANEAQLIADLVLRIQKLYASTQRPITSGTIGIITPYRAQIAQIQRVLELHRIDTSLITIDTVERYQGGAREIILISLCTNAPGQIETLAALSDEGVDRRLNVALTRAREQVIVLGNPEILQYSSLYKALIERFGKWQ